MNRGKLKYRCKCCTVTPRGCDLKRHYKNNVNWPLVKQLKAAKGTEVQELRDGADQHSLFIFDRGYSSENLPSYHNHVLVKEANVVLEEEDQDEAGPSCAVTAKGQRSIASFFQVTLRKLAGGGIVISSGNLQVCNIMGAAVFNFPVQRDRLIGLDGLIFLPLLNIAHCT